MLHLTNNYRSFINYAVLQYGFMSVLPSIADDGTDTLYSMINDTYFEKWDRVYNALNGQYNPLDNYNMQEHIINSGSDTEVKTTQYGQVITDNGDTTNTLTSDNTIGSATTFDSTAFTPTNKSDSTGSSSSHADTTRNYTGKDTIDSDFIHGHTIDTTRSGNIGVTTSQQMLESEMSVRNKFLLYDMIAKDILFIIEAGYYDTD